MSVHSAPEQEEGFTPGGGLSATATYRAAAAFVASWIIVVLALMACRDSYVTRAATTDRGNAAAAHVIGAIDEVAAGPGAVMLAFAIVAAVTPVLAIPRERTTMLWLLFSTAQAWATGLVAFAVLEAPLHDSFALALASATGVTALLFSARVQVALWRRIVRSILRLAPSSSFNEGLRALIVGALPAVVLGGTAGFVVPDDSPAPAWLLVSPRLAVFGSAALLVLGVATWLHVRRAVPSCEA